MDFGTNREKVLCSVALYGRMRAERGMPVISLVVESERGSKQRLMFTLDREDRLWEEHMRLGGRRFRIKLESAPGTQFCFTGGLEIETEG